MPFSRTFSITMVKNFGMVFGVGPPVLAAGPHVNDPHKVVHRLNASYICAKAGPTADEMNVLASSALQKNKPMVFHFVRNNP
jgi:hypothetical protein